MKSNLLHLILSFGLLITLTTGCNRFGAHRTNPANSQSEDPNQPPPPPPPPPVPGPACGTATLVWDRNTETDLAGYRVYMGLSSRVYSTQAQISNPDTTTWSVANLNMNYTYYFAVSAYDFAGNESPLSLEVSKTVTVCP